MNAPGQPAARRLAAATATAAGLVVAAGYLSAQQVFRTTTDMVFLSVTATRGEQIVGGLEAPDFAVFEDGRPQRIEVFSRDPQPIALSLLIDASMSMESKLGLAADAAVGFVERLGDQDTAQVLTFNHRTDIRQPFTADRALLERAIRTTRASGNTALYTALYVAFGELERIARRLPADEVRRQAIVLLSDGQDTTSVLDYDSVVDRAKRSNITVYAIGLSDPAEAGTERFREHDHVLRTLAQVTGGRVFFVDRASQLPDAYNQIADELAAQYTIGYVSTNEARDGQWRTVTVRVAQPGVAARTRAGYYGPSRQP